MRRDAGSWPGSAARWWRRRSLRARVTLASTAGLALALAAAAVLLSSAVRLSLIRNLDNSARQGAREVAALSDASRLPRPAFRWCRAPSPCRSSTPAAGS